jgi:hypothetical protein
MQTNIQPVSFFRRQATVLRIHGVNIRSLGASGTALILCGFYTADGEQVHNEAVTITGDDYDQWGADDTYILDKVIAALDLTPA